MGLQRKFWLYSITCVAALPTIMVPLAFLLYRSLTADAAMQYKRSLLENMPAILMICLFALMGLAILVNEIFRNFILPLDRLKQELQLITAVRPSHRIVLKGSKELLGLADGANKAAELIQSMQESCFHNRHEKTAREEKDFLGALLSDIPGGVIAGNAAGRIFFYTKSAADLVEAMHSSSEGAFPAPPIGLDRSLFTIFAEQIGTTGNTGQWDCGAPGFKNPGSFTDVFFEHSGVRGCLLEIESDKKSGKYYLAFLQYMETSSSGIKYSGRSGRKAARGFPYYDPALINKKPGIHADMRDVNLSDCTYTVFDLETTGFNPARGDEILSIGAVRIVNGRILFEETFYETVDPEGEVPEESTRVHGISRDMLRGQPGIDTVFPAFCRYVEDSVLVCHFAELDSRFLRMQERKTGIKISNPVLDTFYLSQLVQQSEKDHTLESIAHRLGTRVYDRHIAYGDAWTTAEILLKLINFLAAKGIYTLRQIQENGNRIWK